MGSPGVMVEGEGQDVTAMLSRARAGDENASARLAPLVYDELHRLARSYMSRGARGPIMQTTALLHEAYARLLGASSLAWESRAHFFAVAATAMRQILASHARELRALKRGGDRARVTLSEAVGDAGGPDLDLLALDEVLDRLAALDPRQHRVVEMRFLAGMTMEEIALVLDASVSTVEREWRAARAWLAAALAERA